MSTLTSSSSADHARRARSSLPSELGIVAPTHEALDRIDRCAWGWSPAGGGRSGRPARSPLSVNATTDGVIRLPDELTSTLGWPPSTKATTELVVPKVDSNDLGHGNDFLSRGSSRWRASPGRPDFDSNPASRGTGIVIPGYIRQSQCHADQAAAIFTTLCLNGTYERSQGCGESSPAILTARRPADLARCRLAGRYISVVTSRSR
jgi:hypothetical protein